MMGACLFWVKWTWAHISTPHSERGVLPQRIFLLYTLVSAGSRRFRRLREILFLSGELFRTSHLRCYAQLFWILTVQLRCISMHISNRV